MAAANHIQIPVGSPVAAVEASLRHLIRADQLLAVRRTVLLSIPVNILLGIASVLVAWTSGQAEAGLFWFAASLSINVLRILLCRLPLAPAEATWDRELSVDQHLRVHWILALLSGAVWAFIPVLCEG